MLALATVGFAVNFWAWALLSPAGPRPQESLGLTSLQQALVVAVPRHRGVFGPDPGRRADRPVRRPGDVPRGVVRDDPPGALPRRLRSHDVRRTDRRRPSSSASAAPPSRRRACRLRLVRRRPPRHGHRCLRGRHGRDGDQRAHDGQAFRRRAAPPPFVRGPAIVLAAYGVTPRAAAAARAHRPHHRTHREPGRPVAGNGTPADHPWQASALYAVAFGGYVAFSVYLPTYLTSADELTQTVAANRMAASCWSRSCCGPSEGGSSDRFGPNIVLTGVFAVVIFGAAVQAATPDLKPRRHRRVPLDGCCSGRRRGCRLRARRATQPGRDGRRGDRRRRRRRRPGRVRCPHC